MMPVNTINSIEVSSLCNNTCPYCPAKDQAKYREVGLMDMDIFMLALGWVEYFVQHGTQQELNLFGIGEPTLNPNLPEMIYQARYIMPLRLPIHINTNGQWCDKHTFLITERERNYAESLLKAGITEIDITGHDAMLTAKAIRVLQFIGISGRLSFDYIIAPNNWAGQVQWFNPIYDAGHCPWLMRGQVMVMSNGDVTRCCIDAFATGVFAHVRDLDLQDKRVTPFALCNTCHHMQSMLGSRKIR
jgi:hypothetical protein